MPFFWGRLSCTCTLANDLALKLSERSNTLRREPSHAARGVERLRDGDDETESGDNSTSLAKNVLTLFIRFSARDVFYGTLLLLEVQLHNQILDGKLRW